MVRIRFRRVGSKNQPSYRIVAADKESPRDGRFLENLGHYNPRTEPSTVVVDEARLFHWLQHGAQPSESVRKALKPLGTWERWERFKTGEDLETLLEEADAAKIEVDQRTRRDDLFSERSAKKAAAKKEKAAREAVVEEEPAPVAEAETETPEDEAEAAEAVEVPEETPSEPEPEEEDQASGDETEEAVEEPAQEDEADAVPSDDEAESEEMEGSSEAEDQVESEE